jgi:hypothetical protein
VQGSESQLPTVSAPLFHFFLDDYGRRLVASFSPTFSVNDLRGYDAGFFRSRMRLISADRATGDSLDTRKFRPLRFGVVSVGPSD